MPNGNEPVLQAIDSPYNFVPLHEHVHLPEWGKSVSHDVPFSDGLSAEIHYTLTAETPLLVGGQQTSASENAPGQVHPFRFSTGETSYAIPGSSLKGMLRAVMEIAGFGRMRFVDDRALSVRDLTNPAKSFYRDHMTENKRGVIEPNVRSGWLQFDADGTAKLMQCEYSRVEQSVVKEFSDDAEWTTFWNGLNSDTTARKKYQEWDRSFDGIREVFFDPEPVKVHRHSRVSLRYSKARAFGTGSTIGTIVFTGQVGQKHMEFLFHSSAEECFPVEETVLRQFLQIHESSDEWAFWRHQDYIPVFYLGSAENPVSMGLAQMYRLPYQHTIGETIDHSSPGETIDHSSPKHREEPGVANGYDLADLLFGAVGDGEQDNLKGRVSIETATLMNSANKVEQDPTILNGPKPSFYPNYIVQSTEEFVQLKGSTYQTYVTPKEGENSNPRIRGFKRYPVRPVDDASVQPLNEDQKGKLSVQVKLFPLQEGATFSGRIVCHNLRPEELGALLWVLTWGGRDRLRHNLGMGKPFGFGQINLVIDHEQSRLTSNDAVDGAASTLDEDVMAALQSTFVDYMNEQPIRGGWLESPQIRNLLAMADPQASIAYTENTGSRLRHMPLGHYNLAKKSRLVLADYAEATSAASGDLSASQPTENTSGAGLGHAWLDRTVPELQKQHNIRIASGVIQGKPLADKWSKIEDAELKQEVKQVIHELWTKHDLHEQSSRGIKRAREIYGW